MIPYVIHVELDDGSTAFQRIEHMHPSLPLTLCVHDTSDDVYAPIPPHGVIGLN